MKYVPFKQYGQVNTKEMIVGVLNTSAQGMSLDEMRRRCKILDMLEKAEGSVILKDDDFNILAEAMKRQMWARASNDLLRCIDDILAAEEPAASGVKLNGKRTEQPAA